MRTKDRIPFAITEALDEGPRSRLLRGIRRADGRPVLLRVLDPRRSRPRDIERLKHELAFGRDLDLPVIVRPLALETHEGMAVLVLADPGGQPLSRSLGAPMDIGRFLGLATRIAAAVAELHERDVLHRNLNPGNILVDPATGQVKIADLRLASCLPREHEPRASPALIEGSLPYLAPEQTGRIHREVDSRADLYALGVTFHEMLTGRLPFDAKDPLDWVYCHVARVPPPPSALVPAVPEVLSAIVTKLLSKMAEDRYQTARGLHRDLERCLGAWRAGGRIEPFPLGGRDISSRFRIPQKLYGREEETGILLSAFKRVIDAGSPELVLVSGGSGVGKSALGAEIAAAVVRARGSFLPGRFEPHGRCIPGGEIARAFGERVLEILAEERMDAFRERLLGALGAAGRLIVDRIPQLELVIGPQPPVAPLPPAEEERRFRFVFRRFVGALAGDDHPLVLFLDDLHCADPTCVHLLEDLVLQPDTGRLLVIAAYRGGEVGPDHPITRMRDLLRREGARVSEIVLGPLSRGHLAALVADTLHCSGEDAAALADLLHEKTGGNPFFARQFLTALHEERLLDFDGRAGAFRWDIARIRAKGFTDNVAELMIDKLTHLPARTREALSQLACLGSGAEGSFLALARGRPEEETHADLVEAVRAGLAIRRDGAYELLHERVQEAACALIPEQQRAAAHLDLGRRLLSGLSEEGIEERLFDVVKQLERGAALLGDPREREALRRLEARAGRKAMARGAHAAARGYLARAAALLPPDAWSAHHEEALALHLERAECEYLAGDQETASALFDLALSNARSPLDRARVHRARLRFYQSAGRYDDAVAEVRECLRLHGVALPDSDAAIEAAAEAELRQIAVRLRGRAIADLASAPAAEDAGVQAILGLITESMPLLYTARPALCRLVLARGVNICLSRGPTEESALIYSCYSCMLATDMSDVRSAAQFSEMALALNERFGGGSAALSWQLVFHHAALIRVWYAHFSTSLPLIERALAARVEVGDLLGVGYMSYALVWLLLENGDPLDHVIEVARRYAALARQGRNDVMYCVVRIGEQLAASLAGRTRALSCFDDGTFEEAGCVALLAGARFGAGVAYYHIAKQVAAFLHGRYDEALEHAESASRERRAVESMANEATHCFFHALTLAALHPRASAEEQRRFARALGEHVRKLGTWAEGCPANFQARHALVAAELARVEGRDLDAMRLYEDAIRSARENAFVHQEALAHELASRSYRARGYTLIADTYLREARSCYARWGADGKVREMDRQHPFLREPGVRAPAGMFAARPEQLDLLSVTKASQTISSEIVLDELIRTLLAVVLEQGGARRGLLLFPREGALSVEAEAVLEPGGAVTTVLPRAPLGPSQRVPASLVYYVLRTKEPVILSDAAADAGRFSGDEHLRRTRPRSVLCMPIPKQAELVGLLYLENDLIAGAFTPERLTALSLLATQAAIAIDNARLYRKTQEAIEARDEFMSIASHELRTPITSLTITLQSLDRAIRAGRALDPQATGRLLERALRQGARLVQLSNDLLDVSRIQAGRLALEADEVDLEAVTRDVVEQMKPELQRARCAVSIAGGGRIVGRWDRSRVEQILTNLLSNAIKFAAGQPIEITLGEEAGIARLAVRDHGIGIEPDKQRQIFERFERAVSARHYGGLGLGLYISRTIAEAHGGSIRVESEPGAGCTFTVELPCAGPPPRPPAPGAARALAAPDIS